MAAMSTSRIGALTWHSPASSFCTRTLGSVVML
jgi:hypothetical protein